MKRVRWLIGVLLVLVMLGTIASQALAKSMGECVDTRMTTIIQHKSEELSITEIKGKMACIKALNAFKESAKLREYIKNCKLQPIYDRAKVYITKYNSIPTEIIRIPLKGKGNKPAIFIYAKNKFKTIMLIEIVDTNFQKARVYVYDNGKITTKIFKKPNSKVVGNKYSNGVIEPLWISTPGGFGGDHEMISYYSARAVGVTGPYAQILANHSGDPDEYDTGWDRYIKHAYDPDIDFGLAPYACNENVSDAKSSFNSGEIVEGYIHLAHALHYLQDVGNPYHTALELNELPHQINHEYYETLVHNHWTEWNLNQTVFHAPRCTVTSPVSAVKSLASYSSSKFIILDTWVTIYRATGWGYALDNIKGITTDLIKKTAGYSKGLIDYTV